MLRLGKFCLFDMVHLNDLHYLSFELVHLNDLLFDEWVDHVVKEVNVKEALKLSFFDVQKAAAPKNGVEFGQGSNGTIWSSLATSYDVLRRRMCVGTFFKVVLKQTIQPSIQPSNIPILRCFVAEA